MWLRRKGKIIISILELKFRDKGQNQPQGHPNGHPNVSAGVKGTKVHHSATAPVYR